MSKIPFRYRERPGDGRSTDWKEHKVSDDGFYGINYFLYYNHHVEHLEIKDGPVELSMGSSLSCDWNYKLKSVVLPDTLKVLPKNFCNGCDSLKSIVFPDGIETIPDSCCRSCESLESVVLPKSLKKISANAFYFCSNLKNVEFHGDPKSIEHLTCEDNIAKLRESNPVLAIMLKNCKYVSDEENSKKQSVYLEHISEKMIRFVHSDKTGKDYARVGVNIMLDGKQSVGNVLLPAESVTDSVEKNSKYQRTKRMDVCLGEPDDRLKVSLGKNPDGTWQQKFMTAHEIKKSNEEAMRVYRERKISEYNSTIENSSSYEQQSSEFGS